jgi:hypothetical protein
MFELERHYNAISDELEKLKHFEKIQKQVISQSLIIFV